MSGIPQGFEPHFRKSPVTEPWEPLYSRRVDGRVELGLRLAGAHCNGRGLMHGGVIAALADNAMGLSYSAVYEETFGEKKSPLTVSLNLDYVASATPGAWIEITPRVVKVGKSMGFVDALVTADGMVIARASATFRVAS
jgi:uncharacterized protein (TIGR00369 family)